MRLQTKFTLSIIGLVVVTVIAISIFSVNSTIQSMLAQTEQDGQAISQVLAQSSKFAQRVPGQVDNALGDQMVVEARITANMIAVARGRAGMTVAEVNAILKDITDNTVLNEFWISDGTGKVEYTNTGIDFTFESDPSKQPQAYVFYQLLGEKNGVVKQEAMKREIDTRFFKYVGVSGIDEPRIVQVGYKAKLLDELSKDINIQKLIDELTGQANVAAIWVLDSGQKAVARSSQPAKGIGLKLSEEDFHLVKEAVSVGEARSDMQADGLRIATPVLDENGNVQSTIMVFLTMDNVQSAIRSIVLRSVLVSLAAIAIGVLIAFVLSSSITRPVRKLTTAVETMGKGDLSQRVVIDTKDEVGILARSFNKMAGDLQVYMEELRQTTAQKERMQKEMEIGNDIQRSFLPESPPDVEGYEIAALNTPALEVGGDFYDFIPVSLDNWGLVIADVSGKGVPAALFMAMSRTIIRAHAMGNLTVSEAILKANNMTAAEGRTSMFVTVFYGVLDVKKKTLTYVNAGHNPPFVSSIKADGQEAGIMMLAARGIALGVIPDIELEEKEIQLHVGDIVLLYTDGVTEAVNHENEQFGQQRLTKLVEDNRDLSARELIRRIELEVILFGSGQPQFDDITLMAVKVLK